MRSVEYSVYLGQGDPFFAVGDCDIYLAPKDKVWAMVCYAHGLAEFLGAADAYTQVVFHSLLVWAPHTCLSGLFVPRDSDGNTIGMWVLCKYGITETSKLGVVEQLLGVMSRASAAKVLAELRKGKFSVPREVLREVREESRATVLDAVIKAMAPVHTEFVKKYGPRLGVAEEFLRLEDDPLSMTDEEKLKLVVRDLDAFALYMLSLRAGDRELAEEAFRKFRERFPKLFSDGTRM